MVPPASNDERSGEEKEGELGESPGVIGHGFGDVTGLIVEDFSAREAEGSSSMLSDDMEQFSLPDEKPIPNLRGDRESDDDETPDIQVLTVDLHGIKKEQIKLEVPHHKHWIKISVKHTIENVKKLDMWRYIQNCGDKSLRWDLYLPADAKIDQIKASMDNGVLTITVPKGAVQIDGQPEVNSIEISD